MTEKALYLAEGDLGLSGLTKNNVKERFGFDYEPIVTDRLKHWNSLPEGHKLRFFDMPQRHNRSSGLYLAEEIVGTSWIFVQAMLSNGISTKHMHGENVVELYDPLAGESILMVDGKEHKLNPGVSFEVFPGQAHQLKTGENPSLNLLIMKNSAHIPRSKLHVPVT
jgi:mannose-6-phosphate isomerase-like protein (cupin superfamily)